MFNALIRISRRNVAPLLILVAVGLLSMIANTLFQRSICPIVNVFGIPCPACGMTRAYMSLLHLELKEAFIYHPLFIMPIIIALLGLVNKLSTKIALLFLALLIGVWVLRLVLMLPYQIEPIMFEEDALVPMLWGKLQGLISTW